MIDNLLKLTLAFITLGLGFSINRKELAFVFAKPKALFVGLFTQMILLPLVAFIICLVAPFSIPLKVGIFIIAVCPGGTTANLLSYLFKANVSLSISLTTINGVLSIISIPLLTTLFISQFSTEDYLIALPIAATIIDLVLIIILPVAIGILLNHYFNSFKKTLDKALNYVLPILLALVFGVKLFAGSEQGGLGINSSDLMQLFPYLLLLNLSTIALSVLIAYSVLKKNVSNALTIGIETGLQNTALAIIIAQNTGIITIQQPAAIYAGFSFFTTLLFIFIIKKALTKR